jgi:hypothetical protein
LLTIQFNLDGSLIYSIEGDTTGGYWNYEIQTGDLKLTMGKKEFAYKILRITKDELLLKNCKEGKIGETYLRKASI